MAKFHSKFVCQQCGYSQIGWAGKCPDCGSWGSMVETVEETKTGKGKTSHSHVKALKLSDINITSTKRISTKISEFDTVLGGGLVPGQAVLLAGEPGIGKSTILLQLSKNLGNVIYASGEESASQIKIRAERLGIKKQNIAIIESSDIDSIIEAVSDADKPFALIIDSIQTMTTSDLSGMAGSVGQVRECANRLVSFAKKTSIPVVIVGHVTKDGSVAGPATLAHMVDTVCWFEGDKKSDLRLLRSVKNRFGPTDEVGIFKMEEKGLCEVNEIDKMFLSSEELLNPGSATTCVMEGTRPVLVEIQSLVVPTKLPFPRRIVQGIDSKRVELILAILQKHAKMPFYEFDVYTKVVGGLKISDPGADLAIALSLIASLKDKDIARGTVAVGELGLLGEIRSVPAMEKRLKYTKRQGYKPFIAGKAPQNLQKVLILAK